MNHLDLSMLFYGAVALFAFFAVILIPKVFRVVVPVNEVHIVQSSKKTVSYGKDTENGNVYYKWSSWMPFIGVEIIVLPTSVFDIDLLGYEAYDKGRLPFHVDVKAFFRISDSNTAAARVSSFKELTNQLTAVVQGAIRAVLANSDIDEIMQGRSKFGEEFTAEVRTQLQHWGVEPVKNIELMDIRDSKNSTVIQNIMKKRESFIDMESRKEVANNKKIAETAEIEAKREIDLQKQEAIQQVGTRTAEAERLVALANEKKNQEISEVAKLSVEKKLEVEKIKQLKEADIAKQVAITTAEAKLEATKKEAEASLEKSKKDSEGLRLAGEASAYAKKMEQMAPVEAQLALAKEIGSNKDYQSYLIELKKMEALRDIGVNQAEALKQAEIKIIANTGDASSGINSITDLFSSKGGSQVGAMLEGFANTDVGKEALSKLGLTKESKSTTIKQ